MMVKCKECKTNVSSKAKLCPSCGVKDPGVNYFQGTIGLIIIVAAVYFYITPGSNEAPIDNGETKLVQETTKVDTVPRWYDGGTLENKGALDWQKATSANKLASCAYIVSQMAEAGVLVDDVYNQVNSFESLKIISNQLMNDLDSAFKPEANKVQNEKLFANQKVLSTALILAMSNGWIESKKS